MKQGTLLFDDPPPAETPYSEVNVASYVPSQEVTEVLHWFRSWLTDEQGRKTPQAEEALFAVDKALFWGYRSWIPSAQDAVEALALRNGLTQGPDIPAGQRQDDPLDFQRAVQAVRECLNDRAVGRGR